MFINYYDMFHVFSESAVLTSFTELLLIRHTFFVSNMVDEHFRVLFFYLDFEQ